MGAQVPLVMALDDPGAVPGVVGGKGASLARLARAGFRVPPGFQVTTSAYLDFAGRGDLREPVLAAMSAVDVSDAATFDAAAARIGKLFAGQPVPALTAAAIAGAYACLGDDVPVAVRSSATVEDLPGMSAAGQHDTYLNVRGEAAVLDAVKRCWASLWSARAIGYRARRSVEPGDVSIAVVVQQLVPAEAAGVMFTIDPVDGAHDKVVVSANWGLGESVVAGDVTPDVAVIDRASGTLVSYQVGSKEMMTVADGPATRAAGTPPGLRSAAVLRRPRRASWPGSAWRSNSCMASRWTSSGRLPQGCCPWSRPGRSRLLLPARPPGAANGGTTAWPGTTCGATATSARPSLTS